MTTAPTTAPTIAELTAARDAALVTLHHDNAMRIAAAQAARTAKTNYLKTCMALAKATARAEAKETAK